MRVAILVTASDKVGLSQADESTTNPQVGAEEKNGYDTGLQDISENRANLQSHPGLLSLLHFDFSLVDMADGVLDLFLESLVLLCGCVQACVALFNILPQDEQVEFPTDDLEGEEDLDEEGNHPRHGVNLLILLLAQSG